MSLTRRSFLISGAAAGTTLTIPGASRWALAQDKPTVTVGSKNYAEQLIVGQMIVLLLEEAGHAAELRFAADQSPGHAVQRRRDRAHPRQASGGARAVAARERGTMAAPTMNKTLRLAALVPGAA